MEWINKKMVILAIILSLITTGFIFAYVNSFSNNTSSKDIIKVYVAAKAIPEKTLISLADIKAIEIDKKYMQKNSIIRKDDIIGKHAKSDIYEGEQISKDRLANDKEMNLTFSIPKGKRAVSINITESSGVGYKIEQGDFVDIVATFDKEEIVDGTRKVLYPKITKIILQNVQVLSVGEGNIKDEKDAKKGTPKTVTLAINLSDAEKFIYSMESSTMRLMLRPVDDNGILNSQGSMRQEITGTKGMTILPK